MMSRATLPLTVSLVLIVAGLFTIPVIGEDTISAPEPTPAACNNDEVNNPKNVSECKSKCYNYPCFNGGTCIVTSEFSPKCLCAEDGHRIYGGKDCSVEAFKLGLPLMAIVGITAGVGGFIVVIVIILACCLCQREAPKAAAKFDRYKKPDGIPTKELDNTRSGERFDDDVKRSGDCFDDMDESPKDNKWDNISSVSNNNDLRSGEVMYPRGRDHRDQSRDYYGQNARQNANRMSLNDNRDSGPNSGMDRGYDGQFGQRQYEDRRSNGIGLENNRQREFGGMGQDNFAMYERGGQGGNAYGKGSNTNMKGQDNFSMYERGGQGGNAYGKDSNTNFKGQENPNMYDRGHGGNAYGRGPTSNMNGPDHSMMYDRGMGGNAYGRGSNPNLKGPSMHRPGHM